MAYKVPQTQFFIEEDEPLMDELCEPGLRVVEIYSEWCGNCTSVIPTLKRLRMEKDDESCLKFLSVKVDGVTCIEKLDEYRGQSQPVFLFYRVSAVRSHADLHGAAGARNRQQGDAPRASAAARLEGSRGGAGRLHQPPRG
mmetsp:Transcript_7075/g.24552  ORF Transcript_7075/g.24552 Transcript_7075/m.24552 type:complete len:141 (-) Transcript_7075:291-713(-)